MSEEPDARFSFANERTYLAWIRTALALIAGGLVAGKALHFDHDTLRWLVAVPPIVGGALMAEESGRRWRRYEAALAAGRMPETGRHLGVIAWAMTAYAVLVLVVVLVD